MKKLMSAISIVIFTFGLTVEAKSKTSKAEAKKQCLAGEPSLSGKKLQKCIKNLLKKK